MNSGGVSVRDLDLRRVRMFVAVVKSPSLRVAADTLFISQQALSSAIKELERQLGVTLFSRTHRSLTPTDAGMALYQGAIPLLAGGERLATEVQQVAAGTPDPFAIGHTPELAPFEVFQLIEPVVLADPSLPITVRPVFPDQIRDELLSGAIDLALRRSMQSPPDLAAVTATHHELRLAVHASHPIASIERPEMKDVARYPIVAWGPRGESEYTDIIVSHCRRAGFEPEIIVSTLRGTPPHTAVVAHPGACAFVTNQPGWIYRDQIRIVALADPPMAPVMAMWLPHTPSGLRNKILDSLVPWASQESATGDEALVGGDELRARER